MDVLVLSSGSVASGKCDYVVKTSQNGSSSCYNFFLEVKTKISEEFKCNM